MIKFSYFIRLPPISFKSNKRNGRLIFEKLVIEKVKKERRKEKRKIILTRIFFFFFLFFKKTPAIVFEKE